MFGIVVRDLQIRGYVRGRGCGIAVGHSLGIQRIAQCIYKRNGIQRSDFGRHLDQADVHRSGKPALLDAFMHTGPGPDKGITGRCFYIFDFIIILIQDILIEIIHVIGDERTVYIDVRRKIDVVIITVLSVENIVHIQLFGPAVPLRIVSDGIGQYGGIHLLCTVNVTQVNGVHALRNAGINIIACAAHTDTVLRFGIPTAQRIAMAFGIRQRHGLVIKRIRNIRSGTAALRIELGRKTEVVVAPPFKDRITVVHAPRIFAVSVAVQRALQVSEAVGIGHVPLGLTGNGTAGPAVCEAAAGILRLDLAVLIAAGAAAGVVAVIIGTVGVAAQNTAGAVAVGHVAHVIGIGDIVYVPADQAAVGLAGAAALTGDIAHVEAAGDVGPVALAHDAAAVIGGFHVADVHALTKTVVVAAAAAVVAAQDAAAVGTGGNFTVVKAALKRGRTAVGAPAHDAAAGVFTRYVARIEAVVEGLYVILDLTENTAAVVAVTVNIAVVPAVFPGTAAHVRTYNTARRFTGSGDRTAVDVVGKLVRGVRIQLTGHTARAASGTAFSGRDIAGVRAAGDRHLVIVAFAAEITHHTAGSGVRAYVAGVGTVDEVRFVVLDPACQTARVAVGRVNLATVRAIRCVHTAFAVADQTGRTVVIRIDQSGVGTICKRKDIVRAVFADQAADVIVSVNLAAFHMHVFKGYVAVAETHHYGEAVFAVVVVIVDENVFEIYIFECGVLCGAEQPYAVVAVVHTEFIYRMPLSVEGALKVIVTGIIDVFAAVDIAEIDIVQVDIHVKIHRLPAVRGARAAVVDKLREALRGGNVVVGKPAAVPRAVPHIRRLRGQRERGNDAYEQKRRKQNGKNGSHSLFHKKKHSFLRVKRYANIQYNYNTKQ